MAYQSSYLVDNLVKSMKTRQLLIIKINEELPFISAPIPPKDPELSKQFNSNVKPLVELPLKQFLSRRADQLQTKIRAIEKQRFVGVNSEDFVKQLRMQAKQKKYLTVLLDSLKSKKARIDDINAIALALDKELKTKKESTVREISGESILLQLFSKDEFLFKVQGETKETKPK